MNPLKKNPPAVEEQKKTSRQQQQQQPNGWGLPFVLALFMHAILFVGLFFVFQWNTESTDVVYAELWSPSQMRNVTPVTPVKELEKPEPVKEEPEPEPEQESEPEPEPEAPPPPAKVEEPVEQAPDEDVSR